MPRLAPLTDSRLRNSLKRTQKLQTGWLHVFNAVTGKADGTLFTNVPGEIYVTNELNGHSIAVRNSISASYANIRVEVGRKVDQPNLLQIKSVRETFNGPATAGQVIYHASQHTFRQGDWVPIDRKQVMQLTVMVSDPANFIVAVFGGVAPTKDGMVVVETDSGKTYKEIDLSSYIPATGAKYVDIVVEEDGTLAIVEGMEFEAPALATVADVPIPAYNQYIIAYVLLYESMEAVSDNDIRVVFPLSTNYLLNADEFSGFLVGITSIQEAFEALDEHTHETVGNNKYRQLVYVVNGDGSISFVSAGGEAVYILKELEA